MIFIISMLVFYFISVLLVGIRLITRREIDVDRFNHSIYSQGIISGNADSSQGTGIAMSWDTLTPIVLLGGLASGAVVYSISGVLWMAVLSSLAGLLFPKLWVEYQKSAQSDEIDRGMEQATETIATVLRSGGGLAEAFERAGADARTPLNYHLLEAGTLIRTGTSQTEAVDRLCMRIPLKEMNIITVGMRLSAIGMPVNINDMFFEVQKNIRDRLAFNREIRVLVAENKISAWVVAAMPVFLLSFIRQMAPEMVEPLFTTSVGIVVFCLCASMIAIGIYLIMQIVKPKL